MSYLTEFSGEVEIAPPTGKALRDEVNAGAPYDSPYAPFRLYDDCDAIVPTERPAKWYDAAKCLKALHTRLVGYGYELAGVIEWRGESDDDFGRISVTTGGILVERGYRAYRPAKPLRGDEGNFHEN